MKYFVFSYVFIFYVLILDPLQALILKIDGAGRLVFLFAILIVFECFSMRKKISSKPIIYYFLWLIYMFINSSIKGVKYWDDSYYLLFLNIFLPFTFFWIVLNEAILRFTSILNLIIFSLFVYLVLAVAFNGINYDDRVDSALNANAVGLRAAFLIFFIFLKCAYKLVGAETTLYLTVFPTLIIFLTQSRTAFGVMLILFVAFFYILWQRSDRRIRFFFFALSIISFFLVSSLLMNDTDLGKRLASTTTQSVGNKYLTTGTYWDYFGDRGLQYVLSGPIIKNHLFFGIGLRNFMDYSTTNTVLHSEYLINLVEGGFVGFVLYLLFQFWFIKNFIKMWRCSIGSKPVLILFISGYLSMLFLSWVTRVCYYPFYYGYYAVFAAFIYRNKRIRLVKSLNRNFQLIKRKKPHYA